MSCYESGMSNGVDSSTEDRLPTCKCGTDRTREEAIAERDYTLFGALYVMWGGTPVPSVVRFRCVKCGEIFQSCTDMATRRAHIM